MLESLRAIGGAVSEVIMTLAVFVLIQYKSVTDRQTSLL